jgi:hypothetical protein
MKEKTKRWTSFNKMGERKIKEQIIIHFRERERQERKRERLKARRGEMDKETEYRELQRDKGERKMGRKREIDI